MDPHLDLKWQAAVHRIKEEGMAFYETDAPDREDLPETEDFYPVLIKEIVEVPNKKYDPENDSPAYEHKLWWKGEIYEGDYKGLWVSSQTTKVGGPKSRIYQFAQGFAAGTDGKGKGGIKDPDSYKDFEGYVVRALCNSNTSGDRTFNNINSINKILKSPSEVELEKAGAKEEKNDKSEEDIPF